MADQEVGRLNVVIGMDNSGFNKGISNIDRSLRMMQSEFSLASAKIGEFGSAEEQFALKTESLTKQIDLQEKKVSALKAAWLTSRVEKGEDSKATQELEIKLNKATAALTNMHTQLNKNNSAMDDAGKHTHKMADEMDHIEHSSNHASMSILGMYGMMLKFSVAMGAVTATLAPLKFAWDGIQFDSKLESATIAFETFTGSVDSAKKMVQDLEQFAKDTPFEFPQLVTAAQRMMAFGFAASDVLPMLKSIGDAAASSGNMSQQAIDRIVLALGQMKAKTKVQSDEMLQLTEANIPAWEILSKAMGKSTAEVQKMVTDGVVPADFAIQALIKGMEEKFPNMMDKQSKSFEGMISTLKDNMNMTFGKIMQPAFQWLTEIALPKLVTMTDTFSRTVQDEGLREAFKTLIPPGLVDTIYDIGVAFGKVIKFMIDNADQIRIALEIVGVAWGLMKVRALLSIESITAGLKIMRTAIYTAFGPLSLVAIAFVTLYEMASANLFGIGDKFRALGDFLLQFGKSLWHGMIVGFEQGFVWPFAAALQGVISAVNGIGKFFGKDSNIIDWNPLDKVTQSIEENTVELDNATVKVGASFENLKAHLSDWSTPQRSMTDIQEELDRIREKQRQADEAAKNLNTNVPNWKPSFSSVGSDLGKGFEEGSKKAKEKAEETREVWEVAIDGIMEKMETLKAQHELQTAQLRDEATKLEELHLKYQQQNEDIEAQRELIEDLTTKYEAVKEAKGEDSKETAKASMELLKAQTDLSKMQKELRGTEKAWKDQATSIRDLESKLTELNDKYDETIKKQKEDLASALEEYQRKVSNVNKKLVDDEQKLNEQFNKTLDDRAKSIENFVSLFDQIEPKNVSGQQLLSNLKGQVDAFGDWQKNISELSAKGIDEGLLKELRDMGPKAGAEIAALNTLSSDQLQEYVILWKQKAEAARTEATQELEQQRIDTQQKISQLRSDAATQLEEYRKEWEKKNAEIRTNTEKEIAQINKDYQDIVKKSKDYGVNLVVGFANGIRDSFPILDKALAEMADRVDKGITSPLQIFSPSRLMMKYGGFVAEGLAKGIQNSMNLVQAAMTQMANIAPAAVGNSQSVTNNYGGNMMPIYIQGGSVADQADQLMRELYRRGVRFS